MTVNDGSENLGECYRRGFRDPVTDSQGSNLRNGITINRTLRIDAPIS